MDVPKNAPTYLTARVNENSPFQTDWTEIRDLHSGKLWHQLTLKLEALLRNPSFKAQTDLVQFNEVFLNDFKTKISPLSLVEICVSISEQLVASDPLKGVAFMEDIREKYTKKSKEATILCNTTIGMIYLSALGDLANARQVMEDTTVQVEKLGGVTCVHPRFYELSSRYYQMMGQHAEYHREALRYLGCVNLQTLKQTEQRALAFSLGLAAILGEGVYNFGELLMHDVLKSLQNTPDAWLIELLNVFNRGEIGQLEAMRDRWQTQSDLVAAEERMFDKVKLLCLCEIIFRRPPTGRCLTFAEVSTATRVPMEKVEHFLMRALSLGLIKGRIDEVDRKISVTWLRPRVLDREQIGSIRTRLSQWCNTVTESKDLMEIHSRPIFA